jgi:hypothetical protein
MSQIQEALVAAMRDICKIGIGKTSKADKYNYRGIDAAMNEMSPILVNHKITVTPRYSELSLTKYERTEGKFSHCRSMPATRPRSRRRPSPSALCCSSSSSSR